MKSILEQYCNNEQIENGLLLFPMPTGFGKTYNVVEYIYENYKKIKGKIIFTTTLKKNLPFEDLRIRFEENGELNEYKENVLVLDSNVDFIINNLKNNEKDIPSEYKNLDCYKSIMRLLKVIDELSNRDGSSENEDRYTSAAAIVQSAKDELKDKHEREFRSIISQKLKELGEDKEALLYRLRTDKKYRWIGEVYPAVFTDKRKIIFLSIDKFVLKNDTLIEPSYLLTGDKFLQKDSVIFIDEFDATKETVLKQIIDEALKTRVDYLDLFREINAGLSNVEFTQRLKTESQKMGERKKKGKKLYTPSEIIENFKTKSLAIREKFNLRFFHKIKRNDGDNLSSNCFMFHDFYFPTVLKDEKKHFAINTEEKNSINWISIIDKDKEGMRNDTLELLQSIKGFITYFQRGIGWIAENYRDIKKEQGYSEYSDELALKTVLSEFRIEGNHRNWIIQNCLSDFRSRKTSESQKEFDMKVYEKGFRYYHFLDSDEHDTMSKIHLVAFNNTPEKWLLKLTNKVKVVAISATSDLDSVTGNYDLSYLKEKLGKDFKRFTNEQEKEQKGKFDEFVAGYRRGDVTVIPMEVGNNILDDQKAQNYIADSETFKIFINQINDKSKEKFVLKRYLRLFYVMKCFHENPELKSFLCMTQKLPKKDDGTLQYSIIQEYLAYLNKCFPKGIKTESKLLFGSSDAFIEKRNKIISSLEAGAKIFVFSAYGSVGAGQNLQYKIPANERDNIVAVNKFPYGTDDKDFDAIYVDKPAHVAVNIADLGIEPKDILKYLFQVEFLQEAGEISVEEAWPKIRYAFSRLGNYQLDDNRYRISDTSSIENHYIRVILQAIGRICRTKNKKKNIFVYYDSELRELLEKAAVLFENKIINPEFETLIKYCKNENYIQASKDYILVNKANLAARRSYMYISSFLKYEWDEGRINDWKQLRDFVLKRPYVKIDEENIYPSLYVELPRENIGYRYKQENNYGRVNVCFMPDSYFNLHVSDTDARLEELMIIPGLKEYFIENGYKTSFEKAKFLLSPPMFNNIYKGALGEVCGKFILKKFSGIKLEELPKESYEQFDYRVDDIYIDFKHWRNGIHENAEEERINIERKLQKCGGKRVLIINILSKTSHLTDAFTNNGGRILEIPHLYDCINKHIDYKMIQKVAEWIEHEK